jgi:putative ABC transport system permease protein
MTGRSRLVLELALADLRHEWVLTLCMVLSLAAVIAPLMLLMGLKYGTVATLRDRLVQDPRFREIKPAQTREYPKDWFARMAARPEIAFLTPTVLPASSILGVADPSGGHKLWDLVPTAGFDPLLLENGGVIPAGDECVLSASAAEALAVTAGDHIAVRATRIRGSRREAGEARLGVAAVLAPRAGSVPRVYAPLQFVLDVEAYKEGMGIPARGWAGTTPRPYLSLDGVMVVVRERFTPIQESGLVVNTGLSRIETMGAGAFHERTGLKLPENSIVYDLQTLGSAVSFASYRALKGKLRGNGAVLLPYARVQNLGYRYGGEERELAVFGLSLSPAKADILGLPAPPWGALKETAAGDRWRGVLLPQATGVDDEVLSVSLQSRGEDLSFPLQVLGTSPGERALVPAELMGALRTADQRRVRYDAAQGEFLLERGGFRGFRLFTRDIDQVPSLVSELRAEGIEVIAEVEAIERIRVLDRGLSRIFWLVAVVGISGGLAALVASLYAAVERKRQAIGVMRLLGFSHGDLFRFPVFQGVVLALLGLGVGYGAFFSLAAVINRVFADDLAMGQRICHLPPTHLALAVLATLLMAWASTLVAARKSTLIDPAEALRYE